MQITFITFLFTVAAAGLLAFHAVLVAALGPLIYAATMLSAAIIMMALARATSGDANQDELPLDTQKRIEVITA